MSAGKTDLRIIWHTKIVAQEFKLIFWRVFRLETERFVW